MIGFAEGSISLTASAELTVTKGELIARLQALSAGLLVQIVQGVPKRDALHGTVFTARLVIGRVVQHLASPLSLSRLVILNQQEMTGRGAPQIVAHEQRISVLGPDARREDHPTFGYILNTGLCLISDPRAGTHIPAMRVLGRDLVMGEAPWASVIERT